MMMMMSRSSGRSSSVASASAATTTSSSSSLLSSSSSSTATFPVHVRMYSSTSMKLFAGSTDDTTTTTESNNKESSPSSEDNNNNEAIEAKAKAQASAIRLIEFEKKKGLRQKSLEFNSSRAQYAKQVTKLRHKYKLEVETHQAQDLSIQQAEKELTLRRRLERQRSKNERSLENALRQKELKRQQSLAYEDHIKVQHDIRVSKELIQKRAQQLLIHDLENESKEIS